MPQRFAWENAAIYLLLPAQDEAALYLRAKRGISPDALCAGMLTLVRQFVLASEGVALPEETRLTAESLAQRKGSTTEKCLKVLFASVFVLLLIACANASILFSGRTATREQEFGIRYALGAGRGRVLRQLLTESLLLALCGGALGVVIAYGGVAFLRAPLVKSFFPAEAVLSVNDWVLLFSSLVSVATGVLFGMAPALEATRTMTARRGIAPRSRGTHRTLVLLQVSLTLVLIVTAMTTGPHAYGTTPLCRRNCRPFLVWFLQA